MQFTDKKHFGTAPLVMCLLAASLGLCLGLPRYAIGQAPAGASGDASIVKAVGVIKSIEADSITLTAESGGNITAKLAASTKILRVPPGEKDLKNATSLTSQDLQPGDRVLIRGQAAPDAHTLAALAVIVMKQADVSAQQQRERDDWQKRGVGGLVTKVDPATGTVAISSGGFGTAKSVAVHIGSGTILRRYAQDSVKFDEAKPAPLDQVKAGDQLRARGTRSADGSELAAEEVVSGTFRNIAGTITAVDLATNSITVKDLIAKSTVVVKVSADAQMKKLPAEMAQRIAARLKGGGAGTGATGDHAGMQNGSAQNSASAAGNQRGETPGRHSPGNGGNGPPDIQRLISRLPNSTLADLQKGDAVMIVSTSGDANGGESGAVTAITLLAGVDPILTAAPSKSTYSLLSPWSLGSSGGEGESGP
ncbi:MAG: hypothetical protein WAL71_05880 [Terriglobales bacterium]